MIIELLEDGEAQVAPVPPPRPAAPPLPRRIAYPMAGLALSTGAPAGLWLVRALVRRGQRAEGSDLSREWPSYLYVALSTAAVFLGFGRVIGRQADRLAELADTDPLTGLRNARLLQRRLEEELAHALRYAEPLSLLFLDLDGLKVINDQYGHAAGDRALRRVGDAIRGAMRAADIGARWGGDEFALLAPGTPLKAAAALAERLRTTVESAGDPGRHRVTASIGVAAFEPAADAALDAVTLMARADEALYRAKRSGRNRVVAVTKAAPPA